jgi:hypothetical protein
MMREEARGLLGQLQKASANGMRMPSSKLFGSGDMWYAGDSQMKVPLCHSSHYTSRALLYAALWAVDTPHAMLFSTPR